ncbi:MAG: FHA domain-containing protein [Oceanococcus sp.]
MSFVIRQMRGAAANQTIADLLVNRSQITIGRAADRDVLINDARVSWEHAVIRELGDGEYRLDVVPDAGTVLLNGAPVRGGRLKDGDVIVLGGQEIGLRLFEGRSYITVAEAPKQKDQTFNELRANARLSLGEVSVSKRRWSWLLFTIIIAVGLAWPLGVRYSDDLYLLLKSTPLPVDDLWNSGPIASAHQGFGANCKDCHLKLFERVPDRACASCHQDLPHHADDVDMLHASGIADYRCADCHREHNGDEGLVLAHPKICTDCHARPGQSMPGSQLLGASDFFDDHPELSPQRWVESEDGSRQDVSVPAGEVQSEDAALIYPHDLHLLEEGVEDSDGNVVVLQCESCHEYAQGQINFQKVEFQQHCQYCHSLEFDPAVPDQEVPHGNTAAVLDYLRGFYARRVLEGAPDVPVDKPSRGRGRNRSVSSERETGRDTLLKKANGQALDLIDETIRVRLCAKCHTIGAPRSGGSDWDVTPFKQRSLWMTTAQFDHSRHKTESCESCHDARQSDSADDVLMPVIAQCRDCHGGTHAQAPRVRSLCVNCHGFHIADFARMDEVLMMKVDGVQAERKVDDDGREADSTADVVDAADESRLSSE